MVLYVHALNSEYPNKNGNYKKINVVWAFSCRLAFDKFSNPKRDIAEIIFD